MSEKNEWKTVPVEPTAEMWAAVNKLDDEMAAGAYDGKGASIEQVWACLVDAAPSAPQASEAVRLRRIAWLIGSIFGHGDFKAETANERELENLLRENGTFWESLAQFDAALSAQPGAQNPHPKQHNDGGAVYD